MTIETSLCVNYGDRSYELLVKMIRVGSVSYFHIRDKDPADPILKDEQLQISYDQMFSVTSFEANPAVLNTPMPVIEVIQDVIIAHKQIWFWD